MHRLHWRRPGTVWAADFSEPRQPIDGVYPRLLAVRDLASGYQLLWLPVADESEETAVHGLQSLFQQYGAPLVLKSDNGSAFIGDSFAVLLRSFQVLQLFSPPRLPSYNGSCEAGIGSMKTRTHHQAARRGCPGEWTCDDAEAARLQANETARPWGHTAPTPEEAWTARQSIQPEERAAFVAEVFELEKEVRGEQGHPGEGLLDRTAQAAVDRIAIRRALVTASCLDFTSARVAETF
jgi:transposase InsO family protein